MNFIGPGRYNATMAITFASWLGLHLADVAGHARAFELEHPGSVGPG